MRPAVSFGGGTTRDSGGNRAYDGTGWRRLTLEKFRLKFSRCTSRDVAALYVVTLKKTTKRELRFPLVSKSTLENLVLQCVRYVSCYPIARAVLWEDWLEVLTVRIERSEEIYQNIFKNHRTRSFGIAWSNIFKIMDSNEAISCVDFSYWN